MHQRTTATRSLSSPRRTKARAVTLLLPAEPAVARAVRRRRRLVRAQLPGELQERHRVLGGRLRRLPDAPPVHGRGPTMAEARRSENNTEVLPTDALKEAGQQLVSLLAQRAAQAASDRVTDLTGRLTGIAENGGTGVVSAFRGERNDDDRDSDDDPGRRRRRASLRNRRDVQQPEGQGRRPLRRRWRRWRRWQGQEAQGHRHFGIVWTSVFRCVRRTISGRSTKTSRAS